MAYDTIWRLGAAQALAVASGRWRNRIEFCVRRSDVCDRAQLSRLHIFDGRMQNSGCQSYGCGC